MTVDDSDLTSLKVYERESAIRFEYIEKRLDEGSAKFKNDRITPTEKDYKKGVFNRYFIQDKRNNKIIEVTQKNFTKLNLELYTAGVVVEWTLKGPAENINKGPYIYFGAEAKNKEAILEAEKTIKQLSSFVLNNRKFVV